MFEVTGDANGCLTVSTARHELRHTLDGQLAIRLCGGHSLFQRWSLRPSGHVDIPLPLCVHTTIRTYMYAYMKPVHVRMRVHTTRAKKLTGAHSLAFSH